MPPPNGLGIVKIRCTWKWIVRRHSKPAEADFVVAAANQG